MKTQWLSIPGMIWCVAVGAVDCELTHASGFEGLACEASDPLLCRCRDFSGSDLGQWDGELNSEDASMVLNGDSLSLFPMDQTLWFNQSTAYQLYQTLTGDFMVTARVRATRVSVSGIPSEGSIRLGGVMARADCSAPDCENYLFIVLGDDVNDRSVETKNTINSSSTFIGPSWPDTVADLRLCRLGPDFGLYARLPGQAWQEINRYDRPDLPASLNVGPNVYANINPADFEIIYEYIDFATPSTVLDCES